MLAMALYFALSPSIGDADAKSQDRAGGLHGDAGAGRRLL